MQQITIANIYQFLIFLSLISPFWLPHGYTNYDGQQDPYKTHMHYNKWRYTQYIPPISVPQHTAGQKAFDEPNHDGVL